ncbi:uncharacterized protein LOC134816831 isoform X2 [Bolinopsis microptera]|uniref:uncharacterized protein LOC134816831 isoform X2 n=1 Tax=Bolinopsis microptera TaxID=2820187 RepID=UPI0030797BDB
MVRMCQSLIVTLLLLNKITTTSGNADDCYLPEEIENGKRIEYSHNEARYECNIFDGYKLMPASIVKSDGWVKCVGNGNIKPDYPSCEQKLKRIGDLPKSVLEVKQFLSHGPVGKESPHLGEACPEDYVVIREGDDERSTEKVCKQCPMGMYKSKIRECAMCENNMMSIFGATGEDQCFKPRPNIQLLTKEMKEIDENFKENPCKIVKFVGDMIDTCKSSQGLESPICEHLLSHLHENLVNDYMEGNENKWCENNYFMKNVTEEFQESPCTSINNLMLQLESCDSEDDLCSDLTETMSDTVDDVEDMNLCKEKKFLFYVLERILVFENPCDLHKLLISMKTTEMAKRSMMAKPIFDRIDSMVSSEGFVEMIEEWLDTSDFWSVDMCQETTAVKSLIYDDMIDDKCNALKNLGSFNKSCEKEAFQNKNKIACKISEAISMTGMPEKFEEATNLDMFSLDPCEEGERALDHLKGVGKEPCTILESFKDFKSCSDSSLYCKVMSKVLDWFEGDAEEDHIEHEGILGATLSDTYDMSITDINPCEMVKFIDELWVKIGEKPCDMFQIIEKEGSCTSKGAPCKMFSKLVEELTDSEIASEFNDVFGFRLWDMNPCEEWEHAKTFLLALIDRPCSFLSLFESQHKAQCPTGTKSVVCTGLDLAASEISKDSHIQDFLDSINLCEEQDYSVRIFKEVSSQVSKGNCIGYKEVSSYIDDCPKSDPYLCSKFGDFINCLGNGPDRKSNVKKTREGDDKDEMDDVINGICSAALDIRKGAANIETELKDVCTDMFPEVCSVISEFFSEKNEITSCTFKKMLLSLGDALTSDVTTKNIRSIIDSLLDETSFFEEYNKGGLTNTDLECHLTNVFDVISFEALLVPTFADILSSRIVKRYYENIVYPAIDAVLGPIKDDLPSMFSSFGDVFETVMEKIDSAISPVMEMAKDLGAKQFMKDVKVMVAGILKYYFVENEDTSKMMTDVAYLFQIDPTNIYKLPEVSLKKYINLVFENVPDQSEMIDFYMDLSYDDWASHTLVTAGLRNWAFQFSKYMTVIENRAVERGFVCPDEAAASVKKGDMLINLFGGDNNDYDSDYDSDYDKDYDEGDHQYDDNDYNDEHNSDYDMLKRPKRAASASSTTSASSTASASSTTSASSTASATSTATPAPETSPTPSNEFMFVNRTVENAMEWFYLTPVPIDYDIWGGSEKVNVTKYEDEFKYGEKESVKEMMKYMPQFDSDEIPILQLEYGKYYGNVLYWLQKDLLETMKMVYPECNIVKKILNRVEDCKEVQGSIICYPLLMLDQHILNIVRQHCGPICMEAILTIANPCEIPLDVTSEQFDRKNQVVLKVHGNVYHFTELSWDKVLRTGKGYVMRVMGCPLNWLDSYLKNDMASLMQMLEKVAPAAGFPEVYSLMKTHHLDKKITDVAMMGLDLLKRSGITCNSGEDNKRVRYTMEQCDEGEYMSDTGCKSCPGIKYSNKGAYGVDQCDRTDPKSTSCRPVSVRPGFGTLDCTSETPISCTYTCPDDTFFFMKNKVQSKFDFDCDESTKKWSHQDDKNSFGSVPNCAEIKSPSPKLKVAIQFDASECPSETQLSTSIKEYFKTSSEESYDCFKSGDDSQCSVKQVACEALDSSIEINLTVDQKASQDSTKLENVKSKLVDEATEKTLILTIQESRRRRKREDQTLSSNGDVEAEDVTTECDSGYQTIDDDCLACAAGTYYESDGTCTDCPDFTYNDLDAATECSACPEGYYTYGGGHDSLADCIGPCAEGSYRDEVTMSCVVCPEGESSPYNSSSIDSCEGCPVGEYFYNETSQCEKCPLATYNSQAGATSCTSCKTGWFTVGDNKTSDDDCLEPCLPGEFMDMEAEECTTCPEGSTSLPNATSSYDCDLTLEQFVELIEDNADAFEELADDGGIDMDALNEAIEDIEDELEESEVDDPFIEDELEESEVDNDEEPDAGNTILAYGVPFWLGLIMMVLKLNLVFL